MLVNGVKHFTQKDPQHCGPTVISMILTKFGKNLTQEQIADVVMKIDDNSLRLSFMYDIAGHIADLGFWCVYSGNLSDDKAWETLSQLIQMDIPVIALQNFSLTSLGGHYRVVIGIEVGKKGTFIVTFHDPAPGKVGGGPHKQIKKEQFMELWKKRSGDALEFNNTFLIINDKDPRISIDRCKYCSSTNISTESILYQQPPNFRFINANTKIRAKGIYIACKNCDARVAYFQPP